MKIYDVLMEKRKDMTEKEKEVFGELLKATFCCNELPSEIIVRNRWLLMEVSDESLNKYLEGTGIVITKLYSDRDPQHCEWLHIYKVTKSSFKEEGNKEI